MNPALMLLMRSSGPRRIIDNFNRADSSETMGSTSSGELWVPSAGTWGITGGMAYRSSLAEITQATTVEWGSADMIVSAELSMSAASAYPALLARYVDTNNYYLVYLHAGALLIRRRKDGVNVTLSSGQVAAYYDRIALSTVEIDGATRVSVSVNGTVVYTTEDSTLGRPAGTRAGIGAYRTGARFDNFRVEAP